MPLSSAVAVDPSDKDAPLAGAFFSPRFTYHAFGTQETVQGYEELRVAVLFSAYDFRACLDVHFTEQEPGYVRALPGSVYECVYVVASVADMARPVGRV